MIAIAFDLDDTLYNREAPLKYAASYFPPTKDLPFDIFNGEFKKYREIAFEKIVKQELTYQESRIYRIQAALRSLGISITEKDAKEFQDLYCHYLQQIELSPHIQEILDFLYRKNIKTIIITNGSSNYQRRKIKNLGLERYFDYEDIFVAGELNVAKPDLRIFRFAEAKFQLNPIHTWMIGDEFQADIVGAAKAGWNTIWLNQYRESPQSTIVPNKIVHSTYELKKFLFMLFKNL